MYSTGRTYLTRDQCGAASIHRYDGTDNSICGARIDPYWDQLSKHVPEWIPANFITYASMGCCLGAAALLGIACWGPAYEIPAWVAASCIALVLVHQTLDNIDGKHARRTGTCTPLGELIDHGCDAMSLVALSVVIPGIARADSFDEYLMLVTAFMATFHAHAWETRHTGKFLLREINGAIEGIFVGVAYMAGPLITGTNIWAGRLFGVTGHAYFTQTALVVSVVTGVVIIRNVVESGSLSKTVGFVGALIEWTPIQLDLVLYWLWAVNSPSNAPQRHVWVYVWLVGITSCHTITRLILRGITRSSKEPFPLISPLMHTSILGAAGATLFPAAFASHEVGYIFAEAVAATAYHATFLIGVVRQLAAHFEVSPSTGRRY